MTVVLWTLLALAIIVVVGAAAWWMWNWMLDWPTRLKRRLPAPPIGYVWMLTTVPGYSRENYRLELFDVMTEKKLSVKEISFYGRFPDGYDMSGIVGVAKLKVREMTLPELRTESRFL